MNYFNYYTEIEDTFVRRRGRHLFLSPIDWAMIDGWKERGIPLHIVIRSIESVFDVYDRQPTGTRSIKSLFYCREEVEAQYLEWQRSQAGKSAEDDGHNSAGFSLDAIREHIDAVTAKLNAAASGTMAEDVARAVSRLREIREDLTLDFESVDGNLGDVERLLDRALIENWAPGRVAEIERSIRSELRAYRSEMEPDKYKQTVNLLLLKRLREEAGIPRLGLYYI